MRITVFNDTQEDWTMHAGSARGINGERRIPCCQFVDFEGPDDSELFVKVWNGVVMVRFLHSNERLPPLSDGDRMNIEASANLSAAVHDLGDQ